MTRIGQRVMVHHYKGCTVCEHSRSGWPQPFQEEPVLVYGDKAQGGRALAKGAGLHHRALASRGFGAPTPSVNHL
jgi:hypothetical protein